MSEFVRVRRNGNVTQFDLPNRGGSSASQGL